MVGKSHRGVGAGLVSLFLIAGLQASPAVAEEEEVAHLAADITTESPADGGEIALDTAEPFDSEGGWAIIESEETSFELVSYSAASGNALTGIERFSSGDHPAGSSVSPLDCVPVVIPFDINEVVQCLASQDIPLNEPNCTLDLNPSSSCAFWVVDPNLPSTNPDDHIPPIPTLGDPTAISTSARVSQLTSWTNLSGLGLSLKTGVDMGIDVNYDTASPETPPTISLGTPIPFTPNDAASGSYTCVNNRSDSNLRHYPVDRLSESNNKWAMKYLMFPTEYVNARIIVGQGLTDQLELCALGGADGKSGYKTLNTGVTVSTQYPNETIIGWRWKEGKNLSNVSATLGFKVSRPNQPVSIEGSVSITPTSSVNRGNLGEGPIPFPEMAPYEGDRVNSWWASGCAAFRWCGSSEFVGSVTHGLYEYSAIGPIPDPVWGAWIEYHCSNPFGC